MGSAAGAIECDSLEQEGDELAGSSVAMASAQLVGAGKGRYRSTLLKTRLIAA